MTLIVYAVLLLAMVGFLRSPYGAEAREVTESLGQGIIGAFAGAAALATAGAAWAGTLLYDGSFNVGALVLAVIAGAVAGVLSALLWTALSSPSEASLGGGPARIPTLRSGDEEAPDVSILDRYFPWPVRVLVRAGIAAAVLVIGLVVVSQAGLMAQGLLLLAVQVGVILGLKDRLTNSEEAE